MFKNNTEFAVIENHSIYIQDMGYEVLNMLHKGLKAFIEDNIKIAKIVLKFDDTIDGFQKKIDKKMVEVIKYNKNTVNQALNIIKIAGNLERIADMATNICEEVIYIEKGDIVKHHFLDKKYNISK